MGELCRLFLDMQDEKDIPAPDDWLVTQGKKGYGSVYLIASARRVKRKVAGAPPRFSLECFRGYTIADVRASEDKKVWTLEWYARG